MPLLMAVVGGETQPERSSWEAGRRTGTGLGLPRKATGMGRGRPVKVTSSVHCVSGWKRARMSASVCGKRSWGPGLLFGGQVDRVLCRLYPHCGWRWRDTTHCVAASLHSGRDRHEPGVTPHPSSEQTQQESGGHRQNGFLANTLPQGSDCHWETWPSLLCCWLRDSL